MEQQVVGRFDNSPHDVSKYKWVVCQSTSCKDKRLHYERPEISRGKPIKFKVPSDSVGPYFCSIEYSEYYKHESGHLDSPKDIHTNLRRSK